jgi:uncharacterized membrane protein
MDDSRAVPPQRVFLDVTLVPHRSLPPAGFFAVMAVTAGVSFAAGVAFVLIGAWPVCGFFGLEVALLYGAFRLSYRSARQHETIRLTEDEFTVERVSVRGERRFWRFPPVWLRVRVEEFHDDSNRLTVSSHGRTLVLGGFISPGERRDLAERLKEALARWQRRFYDPAPL